MHYWLWGMEALEVYVIFIYGWQLEVMWWRPEVMTSDNNRRKSRSQDLVLTI